DAGGRGRLHTRPVIDRRVGAAAGAALLVIPSLALAAAGPDLVAAATWLERDGEPTPGWLLGLFGDGLGLSGAAFYALLWLALAGYVLLIGFASAISRRALWPLVLGLVALFALAPPLLSQ